MSDVHGQLHLLNSIGMRISVDFITEEDAFASMRALGRNGWGPVEVPSGGFRLPMALHQKFDWSLIGAFPLTIDNEAGVMFQGQFYKLRNFEEQAKGKKLPAAIKYSRGAKPTDDPVAIEKGDGDIGYVTLVTFRGNGKSIPRFEIPQKPAEERPAQPARNAQSQPLRGEALADAQSRGDVPAQTPLQRQIAEIERLAAKHNIPEVALAAVVRDVTTGHTRDYKQINKPEHAAEIAKRIVRLREQVAS